MNNYYFTGIGGIGMSAIAQLFKAQGDIVSGSDRDYDNNINLNLFNKLTTQGIKLYPQDGSGINMELKNLVVSSAIETDNLDIKKAKECNVPITTRAELLAKIVNNGFGIAIGGSNGKTSVTALTGWVLDYAGLDPRIIVGGYLNNYITDTNPGNYKSGKSSNVVIEADESDGSIVNYKPQISVITSISKDHKTIDELSALFRTFANNTIDELIINADCRNIRAAKINHKKITTYGIESEADIRAEDIKYLSWGTRFRSGAVTFELNMPGKFNIFNALAAITVASKLKIPQETIAKALVDFKGIESRMNIMGKVNGNFVINDYAHNPDKIKASIEAIKTHSEKDLIVIFQPHGYGPTKFLKEELISVFASKLSGNDTLIMPEIFYAGGTANKSISSRDITDSLKTKGINANYFSNRNEIIDFLRIESKINHNILILGARDNTLPDFCHEIINNLNNLY